MTKQRPVTVLIVLLSFFQSTFAQPGIKQFVQEHAQPVASIDPDSVNFSDLEVMGKAIGNARVVMLGEQDHGDAPAFLAKTRIIKYLHEQKGFDVLAFESNFFGLNYDVDQVKAGSLSIDSFMLQNIFSIWTFCNACVPLFYKYIPATQKTSHPLELTGFDNQLLSANLFKAIDSELKRVQAPIIKQEGYETEILPLISKWYDHLKDSVMIGKCKQYLKEIKQQLSAVKDNNGFWPLVLDNQLTNVEQFRLRQTKELDRYKRMGIRDSMMAINLKWLTEVKYAGKKIIVWAHNYHISKYNGHYEQPWLKDVKTMGSCYTSDAGMRAQTYVLGFTSYEGTAGRLGTKPYKVSGPEKNSVERWMNKDYRFAFLNFQDYNAGNTQQQESFYMSGAINGSAYHRSHKAQWTNIFDGVFYIKEMYPCKDKSKK